MFFDIILLNSQHGGRFGIAWLAATRGLRFITKKQVKELNLLKLCDELKLFIISYSASPKKRFSLRLSAILINGVVKIFKEQATTLQVDLFSLMSTIHLPAGIRSVADLADTGIFETPPTPIPKTKTKRGRKVIRETPDINLQSRFKADETFLHLPNVEDILKLARADDISIREEMPKRIELIEDDFGLGVLTRKEVEEEMQSLFAKSQEIPKVQPQYPSSDSLPPQDLIEVVVQIHAPKDGFTGREELEVLEYPESKIGEQAPANEPIPLLASTEPVSEHIGVIESALTEPIKVIQPILAEEATPVKEIHPAINPFATVPTAHIPSILEGSIQPDMPAKASVEIAKSGKTRKGDRKKLAELQLDEITPKTTQVTQEKDRLLLKPFMNKFVRINRCNENEDQFINDTCPLPIPYTSSLNENLYNMFWADDVMENIQIRGVSTLKSLSLRESIDLRRTGTGSAQASTLESVSETGIRQSVQPLETPEQESVLTGSKRIVEDIVKQISIEEPIVPTSTPRKRKRTTLPVDELIKEQKDAEHIKPVSFFEKTVEVPESSALLDQITFAEKDVVLEHVPVPEANISQPLTEIQAQVPLETISHDRETMETSSTNDYKLRQQRIINIVAKWNPGQGILTIEDLCEPPIYRLNIARAFSDLLTLAANRFLILKSEADSIELKSIEKGPKLINC